MKISFNHRMHAPVLNGRLDTKRLQNSCWVQYQMNDSSGYESNTVNIVQTHIRFFASMRRYPCISCVYVSFNLRFPVCEFEFILDSSRGIHNLQFLESPKRKIQNREIPISKQHHLENRKFS